MGLTDLEAPPPFSGLPHLEGPSLVGGIQQQFSSEEVQLRVELVQHQ